MLRSSLLLALLGCALASHNSYVYQIPPGGQYRVVPGPNPPGGVIPPGGNPPVQQPGPGNQITFQIRKPVVSTTNRTVVMIKDGQRVIINCNVCRICCSGNPKITVISGKPAPPGSYYPIPPQLPVPGVPGIPGVPRVPGPPGGPQVPGVPEQPVPPPQGPYNPYYPQAPGQYATAPPLTTRPPLPPCVPVTTTTTTTLAPTYPPCQYTPAPPATYPPTDAPTQPTERVTPTWPSFPGTDAPVPTPRVPEGPTNNNECCYIDLRSIQATVSCGVALGSRTGCCSQSCSSSVQRQISINFQLLSRYFGQIPPQMKCSDAVRFGLVQQSEINYVCTSGTPPFVTLPPIDPTRGPYPPNPTPQGPYPPNPTGNPPFPENPEVVIPPGGYVVPSGETPGAYATVPKSASTSIVASVFAIILATVLCF